LNFVDQNKDVVVGVASWEKTKLEIIEEVDVKEMGAQT
jgi:hypothetical protein